MTTDPFAPALDRLVRDDPPADDAEYRRFRAAFADVYPVAPWRRWARRESERRAGRTEETPP